MNWIVISGCYINVSEIVCCYEERNEYIIALTNGKTITKRVGDGIWLKNFIRSLKKSANTITIVDEFKRR